MTVEKPDLKQRFEQDITLGDPQQTVRLFTGWISEGSPTDTDHILHNLIQKKWKPPGKGGEDEKKTYQCTSGQRKKWLVGEKMSERVVVVGQEEEDSRVR